MRRKHKDKVAEVSTKTEVEQKQFYDNEKRKGIYAYNMQFMSDPEMVKNEHLFMRERQPKHKDILKLCTGCNKFLSARTFYKHRINCSGVIAMPVKPAYFNMNALHNDPQFSEHILSKFRNSDVGNLCRTNPMIKLIGYRRFCLRRAEENKFDEVRKCVMAEMRDLARLFIEFQKLSEDPVTFENMFTRQKKDILFEAIDTLASYDDGTEKYGLKLGIQAVIQKAIKALRGHYNDIMEEEKYQELECFQLSFNYHVPELFAGARFQALKASVNKNRRPSKLPMRDALTKHKEYTLNQIKEILKGDFKLSDYPLLRNLIMCRFTLYNARRGEESARLLLQEWEDAEDGVWLPPELVEDVNDPAQKFLVGQFKLIYLHGKGRKFVPNLVANDLVPAIRILVKYRQAYGIKDSNKFLFATKDSDRHASGWHAVNAVSVKAGVPDINATVNRHYVSSVYASLDMSISDEKIYLGHMGHEKEISQDNYQCPIGTAIREITVMGSLLQDIDDGEFSILNSVFNSFSMCSPSE